MCLRRRYRFGSQPEASQSGRSSEQATQKHGSYLVVKLASDGVGLLTVVNRLSSFSKVGSEAV